MILMVMPAVYLCPMALRLLKCTGFGVEICIGKLVAQSESGGVCDSPSHRTIVVSILLLDEFKWSFVSILIGPSARGQWGAWVPDYLVCTAKRIGQN